MNSLFRVLKSLWILQIDPSISFEIELELSTTITIAGDVTVVSAAETRMTTAVNTCHQDAADNASQAASNIVTSVNSNTLHITTVAHSTTTSAASSSGAANTIKTASNREQSHRRSLRNLACIMSAFLFFIAPYACCGIYTTITGIQECVSYEFNSYLMWSPYFICLANPLVVMLVQKDFRLALKSLFCRKVE